MKDLEPVVAAFKELLESFTCETADLVLVGGRMERLEGRFLRQLAADLGLDRQTAKSILDVIRLKNGA